MPEVIYGYENEVSKRGESGVVRSKKCDNGCFINKYYPECETLYDNFQRGLRINPNGKCYGYRPLDKEGRVLPYKWFTYTEVWNRVQNFASGLLYLDLVPSNGDYHILGIYARNCVEWGLCEQTCNAYSLTLCPVYDTLTPDSVDYIFNQTGMKTCVCGPAETFKVLSACIKYDSLKCIIKIGTITADDQKMASDAGVVLYTFKDIEQVGASHHYNPIPPTPDDIHTICYTSGTTGTPKGALLSHKASCSDAYACLIHIPIYGTPEDCYLSYLPMAHVLERVVQVLIIAGGGHIGFYQGSSKTIVDDMKSLRPTVFASVPRLLVKVYDTIMKQVENQGYISQYLFHKALQAKTEYLKEGYTTHKLWDRLVFNGIKSAIGLDRCRLLLSGSAPLPPEVITFLRCLLGTMVMEGYGATEVAGCSILQIPEDKTSGNIGGPTPSCEIKLIDVPDMGYLTIDRHHNDLLCVARGELLIRGPLLFSGYYKQPEETKSAIDANGWYHTGDIAVLLPNYSIKIVDRKKNFFKLSQGEYVAAEKLELIYSKSKFVSQVLVYGDSTRHFLIAIVVPERHAVLEWYQNKYHKTTDFKDICNMEELKQEIQNDFNNIQKENKLRGIEKIRDLIIDSESWTVENDLLTPTFKLKRKAVHNKYSTLIDSTYKKNK